MGYESLIARLKSTAFSTNTNTDIDIFVERNAREPMNELEMTKMISALVLSVEKLQSESNSVVKAVSWASAATSGAIVIPVSGNYTAIVFGSGERDTSGGLITVDVTINTNGVGGTVVFPALGVPIGQIDMNQSLIPKVVTGESFSEGDSVTFTSASGDANVTVGANDRFTVILIKEA